MYVCVKYTLLNGAHVSMYVCVYICEYKLTLLNESNVSMYVCVYVCECYHGDTYTRTYTKTHKHVQDLNRERERENNVYYAS